MHDARTSGDDNTISYHSASGGLAYNPNKSVDNHSYAPPFANSATNVNMHDCLVPHHINAVSS